MFSDDCSVKSFTVVMMLFCFLSLFFVVYGVMHIVSNDDVVVVGVVSSVEAYGHYFDVVIDGKCYRANFGLGFDDMLRLVGKTVVLECWVEPWSSSHANRFGTIREVV